MQILFFWGILLLFPIFSLLYSIVGISKAPSKWRRYLPFYIYFIFIAAYCYVPPTGSNVDLVRYFKILEELKGMSLMETVHRLSDSLYAENLLYWFVANTHMPHLLPAITTATVYGIGAYITCDIAKPEDYKYIIRILVIQAIMIPYFAVVSNIRNVFAFALIILASYLDLVKYKRSILVLLLYVLPIFMHKTGIIILVIRLLVPVFKRAYITALLMLFGLSWIINFAYSHISIIPFRGPIGVIIRRLITSSYSYLLGESEYAERVRNSLGATVTRYMIFAFLILMLVLYIIKFRKNRQVSDIDVMGYLLCILSLSCNAIDTPAYWRFAAAFCILIPSIMYSFYRKEIVSGFQKRWIGTGLSIYLMLRSALLLYRASINWNETISAFAFTNFYTLIITFFKLLLTM